MRDGHRRSTRYGMSTALPTFSGEIVEILAVEVFSRLHILRYILVISKAGKKRPSTLVADAFSAPFQTSEQIKGIQIEGRRTNENGTCRSTVSSESIFVGKLFDHLKKVLARKMRVKNATTTTAKYLIRAKMPSDSEQQLQLESRSVSAPSAAAKTSLPDSATPTIASGAASGST